MHLASKANAFQRDLDGAKKVVNESSLVVCFKTVCFKTVCFKTVCFKTVCFKTVCL